MATPLFFSRNHLSAVMLICSSIILFSSPVIAEDDIEETIVTATRTEKLTSELLVSNVVITREEIEAMQASDLAELLRFQAGLDIGRNGGAGQTTSLFIRGTESNHALVLIDGVEMNPGTIGGAAIQNINPDIIERIEIVKGPRSAFYGSEAVGGVVNIITRQANKTSVSTSIAYGSDDNKEINAYSAFRDDERYASFSLAWQETDGIASLRGQSDPRGFDNLSLNFKGGLTLGKLALELSHWQASGNTEYYGFDTASFNIGPLDQDFRNSVSAFSVNSDLNKNWNSKLVLASAQDLIEQNQFDFFFFPKPQKDRVETERVSVDWQNTLTRDSHTYIAGAYFEREDADSLSFGSAYSDSTDSKAVYVGQNGRIGKIDTVLGARFTDHESAGSQFSWNADAAFDFTPNIKAGFTAGRAFRAPDATDRYGFGGNPELKTEESTSVSALVNWQSPVGDLKLELFQTNIDNLIESVNIDPVNFIFQNINVAETEIKGVELSHSINWYDWLIDSTALVQSPKDKLDNSVLLRRARRSFSTHIQKEFDALSFGLQLLAISSRSDIDAVSFAPVQTGGYVLANLTGSYAVNDYATLFAKIDNLLDSDYETAAGYSQNERNYRLSLRLQY